MVQHLTERGLFEEAGRESVGDYECLQTIDEFVESIHSQNGFSRDRMPTHAAGEFDLAVADLAHPYEIDGRLPFQVVGSVVWGRARDAS